MLNMDEPSNALGKVLLFEEILKRFLGEKS